MTAVGTGSSVSCCLVRPGWVLGKMQKKGLAEPPEQKKGEDSQEMKSRGVII